MKSNYQAPEMRVICFQMDDVVRASIQTGDDNIGHTPQSWWQE